jgi:hypothetical protein
VSDPQNLMILDAEQLDIDLMVQVLQQLYHAGS